VKNWFTKPLLFQMQNLCRYAEVSAATKILRDRADSYDAKLSVEFQTGVQEEKAAQMAKLRNAELQLKQLQVLKVGRCKLNPPPPPPPHAVDP
jgi:hypothetical protein